MSRLSTSLDLDFATDPSAENLPRAAQFLLCGCLAILLMVWIFGRSVESDIIEIENSMAQERTTIPAVLSANKMTAEERRDRYGQGQLAMPWSNLFDGIEGAVSPKVYVLRLEAMSDNGLLRLEGVADTLDQVTNYVGLLHGQGLRDVELVSHGPSKSQANRQGNRQTNRQGGRQGNKPIEFALSARWALAPVVGRIRGAR